MLLKQTDESNPADWFALAADRVKIADLAWKHEGLTASGIECLQEAVERFQKGYLIAKGWKLVKTHDLERSIGEAARIDPSFKVFAPVCVQLTEDFFAQHYPGSDMTDFGKDYENIRAKSGELIVLISKHLPKYFPTS